MAVASLILGIIAVVTCCVFYISGICAILALVFGIVARGKGAGGMALAGIILGASGLILTIALIVLMLASPSLIYDDEFSTYTSIRALLRR